MCFLSVTQAFSLFHWIDIGHRFLWRFVSSSQVPNVREMFNHVFIHFCIDIQSTKEKIPEIPSAVTVRLNNSTLNHRKQSDWTSCSWSFVCSECARVLRVFVICLLFATLNRMMHEIKIGKMNRANGISALLIEHWLNNSETLYPLSRPLLLKWCIHGTNLI